MVNAGFKIVVASFYLVVWGQLLYKAVETAFTIRLIAIEEYGRVIHEFDPYFNYRATEYLYEHGWKKFSQWFDYKVWYPLGRPVGTTIYPGMQVTSVFIKNYILKDWSVNDICVFVPAWFGVLATIATALLCYECSVGTTNTAPTASGETKSNARGQEFGSFLSRIPIVNVVYGKLIVPLTGLFLRALVAVTGSNWGLKPHAQSSNMASPALECALFTAGIMAIVPAHIMRSIGGGYDNESIAMTAMSTTFYCWVRSLRGNDRPNYLWSVLSGFAYFYMAAAWGGYVFVLNLIGVHASLLVLIGRYTTKLHRAYSLFFVIGTTLAIQVPVVGWTPLRSLEQLGPLATFFAFQLIEACEIIRRKKKLNKVQAWKLRVMVFAGVGLVVLAIGYVLGQTGYFGPISSRVRGLFVKHTKTGNPLVDSVAEHQPSSPEAYFRYLHNACYVAPVGFFMVALFFFHDASSFLLVYGVAAYFFASKMNRLILLTGPIASVLGGLALGRFWGWFIGAIMEDRPSFLAILKFGQELEKDEETPSKEENPKANATKNKGKNGVNKERGEIAPVVTAVTATRVDSIFVRIIRIVGCAWLIWKSKPYFEDFHTECHHMAKGMSHPSIITKGQTHDGRIVTVDDYREAYWWLRDNTPEDSRIMAWWDYGYQITGIANRTTIADGNTWNHEHIALLGKALTSSEKEGHRIARHLADYVLLWTGGGGDDVAKSPHMARIANSVYRDICPGDPTCSTFGMTNQGPTLKMRESLLFKLSTHGQQQDMGADRNRFRQVYTSKHGKVIIFKVMSVSKESKAWVTNRDNMLCDAEGSWYCPGQYPPALQKILKEKKDFAQLEDFNRGTKDEDYQKQYMENLK